MRLPSLYFIAFLFLLLLLATWDVNGQTADSLTSGARSTISLEYLQIKSVIIIGNKHTKNYIIAREMHYRAGDSILKKDILVLLEIERQHIYNTTLFVEVNVVPQFLGGSTFNLIVTVKERWYIFPIPKFQLVDRSFNEWVHKYHASLERVNYGVNFVHNNLTGRKDKLKITLITGYAQNISGSYTPSYTNQKLTAGYSVGAGYTQMREIPYFTTYQNQSLFLKQDGFVSRSWYGTASYNIRKAIKKKQALRLKVTHLEISDSITHFLNSGYYNTSNTQRLFVDVAYQLNYDDVDNILYPLSGWSGKMVLLKRGIGFTGGINMFSMQGALDRYISLGHKWFTGVHLQAEVKLPFEQPYLNQRAFGYEENYIRGLELYVIDGVADALVKMNLKRQIVHFTLPGIKRSLTYSRIPFTIYAKTFADFGYVYNKANIAAMLNNKLLYSAGFGFDIVTLYDIHLRLEYSFNQLGENGLFLHNGAGL